MIVGPRAMVDEEMRKEMGEELGRRLGDQARLVLPGGKPFVR